MTNKEAIERIKNVVRIMQSPRTIIPYCKEELEALDLAIKALEFMDEHSDSILNETESEALLTYLRGEENE